MTAKGHLKNQAYLELIFRWILGVTFIYSCCHKIAAPAEFAKIIYGYQLFPAVSINLIAIVLPFLELYCGVALVLGIYPRSAAVLINTMLLGFILAISANLIRGVDFDCGCFSFSESGHPLSAVHLLIRDIILFLIALYVICYNHPRKLAVVMTPKKRR